MAAAPQPPSSSLPRSFRIPPLPIRPYDYQEMTTHLPFELHVKSTSVWLSATIRAMVDKPAAVCVETTLREDGSVDLTLRVHPDDMGHVIGRAGRNAQALRAVVLAIGRNRGIRYRLDIAGFTR